MMELLLLLTTTLNAGWGYRCELPGTAWAVLALLLLHLPLSFFFFFFSSGSLVSKIHSVSSFFAETIFTALIKKQLYSLLFTAACGTSCLILIAGVTGAFYPA